MALHSKLFVGDAALESAAVSNPAHIKLGDRGPHVRKIQTALILLESARIAYDEARGSFYGPSTAAAVLAYKQKRSIINRSYQTQADDIVGKMTIASLDEEMRAWESRPHPPVRIWPLSYQRIRPSRSTSLVVALTSSRQHSALNAPASSAVTAAPHFQQRVLVLARNGTGTFVVADGAGGVLRNFDPDLVKIEHASFLEWAPAAAGELAITTDLQTFRAVAGNKLGEAMVDAKASGSLADLSIVITKLFPAPPDFHPAPPHNHVPCGKWKAIQADPQSDSTVAIVCSVADDPKKVMDSAKAFMSKAPLAVEHLDWYLTKGNGADFVEDDNIRRWINQDSKIRARLKTEIFPPRKKKRAEGHFFFDRNDFDRSKTEDFALSFGSIDRVDFSVDFSDDTVRVWFQDRYDFHPVFPGLYRSEAGDFRRGDNCIHAAAVEMKSQSARDYWMKGQAVVPLSLIVGP
jgi:hypothetical protein